MDEESDGDGGGAGFASRAVGKAGKGKLNVKEWRTIRVVKGKDDC